MDLYRSRLNLVKGGENQQEFSGHFFSLLCPLHAETVPQLILKYRSMSKYFLTIIYL